MAVNDRTLRLLRGLQIHLDDALDATFKHLIEAWALAWNELSDEWHTLMMDIADDRANGVKVSASKLARTRRVAAVLRETESRLRDLCAELDLQVERTLPDVVKGAPKWQRDLWESQMPPGTPAATLEQMLVVVDHEAVDQMISRAAEQIHSSAQPIPYQVSQAMKGELIRGVALGDNPRFTAARMVARVKDRFDLGLTRAMVIARTETIDAHRRAAQLWRMDNSDVLAGWQWVAKLDRRTCPSCWSQHGSIHEVDAEGPLDHQQGRCTGVPVTKTWRDLGFDVDEPDSTLPDAETVFYQMPVADQVAVMGRARLDLLKSGKASWADLSSKRTTTGWRDSFHPTPVGKLAS